MVSLYGTQSKINVYHCTLRHLQKFLQDKVHIQKHALLFRHMQLLHSMGWIHKGDVVVGNRFHGHFQSIHEDTGHIRIRDFLLHNKIRQIFKRTFRKQARNKGMTISILFPLVRELFKAMVYLNFRHTLRLREIHSWAEK